MQNYTFNEVKTSNYQSINIHTEIPANSCSSSELKLYHLIKSDNALQAIEMKSNSIQFCQEYSNYIIGFTSNKEMYYSQKLKFEPSDSKEILVPLQLISKKIENQDVLSGIINDL